MLDSLRELLQKVSPRRRNTAKKTILFAPLDSVGHINSLVSIANYLKALDHRTVFLFIEPIKNNLKQNGHEVYDSTTPDLIESIPSEIAQDKWNEITKQSQSYWQSGDTIANLEWETKVGFGTMVEDIKKFNSNVEKKLELIKPDVIVIDHYFGIPALFQCGKPWIRIFSASPLGLYNHPDLPAAWLGLPTKWDKSNPVDAEKVKRAIAAREKLYQSYNEYWRSFGLPDLPRDPISYIPVSPYLNIYMYPKELDYNEYLLKGWRRCDCMVRDQKAGKFEVPEKLRNKPGKIIFLSMGSLASADIVLMKRLTSMLADSPHRFIVCKGPLHDQLELADNMWGEEFVPQLEVLTITDLIITHGGNNTLTESFFYGVPGYIVCPLFGDQFDNAQRLQEKGFGIKLDPYNCSKEELFGAIESMLVKEDVKPRIKTISERMQRPNARNKVNKLVSECISKL